MKQKEAIEILKQGNNVFLTGPAGSGKTFLLNKYIDYLKKNKIQVSVTASTGIAASHINGRTIHSWSGIGINEKLTDSQLKGLKEKDNLASRIIPAKVLVIDEISMLNANRLDLIDQVCKVFKQDLRPFGGMQVILCGDFFQLPPVSRGDEDSRFVTESKIWNKMDLKICYLEEQHRQGDKEFLSVLSDIRNNTVNNKTHELLKKSLNRKIGSNIKPTILHTHNINVDTHNNIELDKLEEDGYIYEMHSEGVPYLVESLKNGYCLAPEVLKLKIGAVVMFVKNNFAKKYVNGTLGKVIGFDDDNNYPIVETFSGDLITALQENWIIEEGGETVASVSQVPLRLAWAITIHKSQGMSLDCAEIDLSKTFEDGMGYVALSRVRSLDGINLIGINDRALKVDDEVIKFNKKLIKNSKKDLKEYTQLGKIAVKKMQQSFIQNNKGSNLAGGLFTARY